MANSSLYLLFKISEYYKTPYVINTSHNTHFIKPIISHFSQILHTSNTDTHLCYFHCFPLFLTLNFSRGHRGFHHYANVFQYKTLVLFTNFSKSVIKDEIGYAWCPSRMQSLKLQPKTLPLFQRVKLKENTLICPQGWEI